MTKQKINIGSKTEQGSRARFQTYKDRLDGLDVERIADVQDAFRKYAEISEQREGGMKFRYKTRIPFEGPLMQFIENAKKFREYLKILQSAIGAGPLFMEHGRQVFKETGLDVKEIPEEYVSELQKEAKKMDYKQKIQLLAYLMLHGIRNMGSYPDQIRGLEMSISADGWRSNTGELSFDKCRIGFAYEEDAIRPFCGSFKRNPDKPQEFDKFVRMLDQGKYCKDLCSDGCCYGLPYYDTPNVVIGALEREGFGDFGFDFYRINGLLRVASLLRRIKTVGEDETSFSQIKRIIEWDKLDDAQAKGMVELLDNSHAYLFKEPGILVYIVTKNNMCTCGCAAGDYWNEIGVLGPGGHLRERLSPFNSLDRSGLEEDFPSNQVCGITDVTRSERGYVVGFIDGNRWQRRISVV